MADGLNGHPHADFWDFWDRHSAARAQRTPASVRAPTGTGETGETGGTRETGVLSSCRTTLEEASRGNLAMLEPVLLLVGCALFGVAVVSDLTGRWIPDSVPLGLLAMFGLYAVTVGHMVAGVGPYRKRGGPAVGRVCVVYAGWARRWRRQAHGGGRLVGRPV